MTDEEQKKVIGDNLSSLIEKSGKEQKQIAIDIDVNFTTLNSWVKGRAMPPVSQLQRIAKYFKVGLLDIVNKDYDESRKKILINMYSTLNDDGKSELIKYAKLLVKSGEYTYYDYHVNQAADFESIIRRPTDEQSD